MSSSSGDNVRWASAHSSVERERIPSGVASVLTPSAVGAVAVIQVVIPDTARAGEILSPFGTRVVSELGAAPINRILFGTWGHEELVVIRTSDMAWEIQCHGGPAAIRTILQSLSSAGVRVLSPDEFRLQHGQRPQTTVETSVAETDRQVIESAIQDALMRCRTRQSATWILKQSDGRLLRFREQLRACALAERAELLGSMASWARIGRWLSEPIRVTLAGPPNAGKSSLLNAMAGRSRSIVSEIPGTTRDVVEAEIVSGGWLIQVHDTAGLRSDPSNEIEQAGIQRSRQTVESSDLCVCVMDLSSPELPLELIQDISRVAPRCLLVGNKSDLLEQDNASDPAWAHCFRESVDACLQVSARNGTGIDEIASTIIRLLIPSAISSDQVLPLPGSYEDLWADAEPPFIPHGERRV